MKQVQPVPPVRLHQRQRRLLILVPERALEFLTRSTVKSLTLSYRRETWITSTASIFVEVPRSELVALKVSAVNSPAPTPPTVAPWVLYRDALKPCSKEPIKAVVQSAL